MLPTEIEIRLLTGKDYERGSKMLIKECVYAEVPHFSCKNHSRKVCARKYPDLDRKCEHILMRCFACDDVFI